MHHQIRRVVLCSLMAASGLIGATIDVSINSSAVAGSLLRVAIDFTTSSPGQVLFCSPTCLQIQNFAAPGSTMGLPDTTGGLVQGDLILLQNPANVTEIEKGSAFNEVIVNLNPVGSLISFTLSYSEMGPPSGLPPDQVSVFLLDTNYLPMFSTSDPTGANALFSIDLNGTPGGDISTFAPTVRNANKVSITVPDGGSHPVVPEPGALGLTAAGVTLLFVSARRKRFPWRETE